MSKNNFPKYQEYKYSASDSHNSEDNVGCAGIFAFLLLFAISLIVCSIIGFDSKAVLVIFSILLLVIGTIYVIKHFNG